MSHPINQPITYTALASTQGSPSNTFAYAWAFDDNTTATTASTAKTWSTAANHLATVTATDNVTGGSAAASKNIVTTDWSALTWVSTSQKIIPTASASITTTPIFYAFRLLKSGNLLINAFDVNNPANIVVYDTSSGTRTEYPSVTGTVGNILSAIVLTSGINAGNVLVVGQGNGKYGFFNPNTGVFVVSGNTMPVSVFGNPTIRSAMTILGNGTILMLGTSTTACLLYNQSTDSWSTTGNALQVYLQDLFTLPSGNAIAIDDGATATYLYNQTSGVWSSGPALPDAIAADNYSVGQSPNGKLFVVKVGSTCPAYMWTEGNPSFTAMTANYPFASQDASATASNFQQVVPTSDGNVVVVGGSVSGGGGKDTKSIIYYTPNDSWVVSAPLLAAGVAYRGAQLNGKLWRCGSTGVLEYMVWS